MNALTLIMLIFSAISALDRIFGGRLGLGREFERGFMLLGTMALSMIGMIVLAPAISSFVSPVFDLLYSTFRIDPSVIPASLFANDMGGASMSAQVAKSTEIGLFNALVVSSMMGCTVSFSIPYAVSAVEKSKHRELFLGMLCGVSTIPIGCFVSGLMLGIELPLLLLNLLPLIIFAVIIALGLVFAPNVSIKIFSVLGTLIKALITVGLVLGSINFLTGRAVIKGLGSVEEAALICINAAIVFSGAFPLMSLASKLLKKPMSALGRRLKINDVSAIGFVGSLVTNVTTYEQMKDMDSRGVILNSAFAVSAAFSLGAHLAFTLAFASELTVPVIVGKLVSGFSALAAALVISRKFAKENE